MPTTIPLVTIPVIPSPQSITLPGGVTFEVLNVLRPGVTPAQTLQPALTPLIPVFDIVRATTSLFDLIKLTTEAIGDPSKLAEIPEKIAEVAETMTKLAALVPQLSLPLTIVGLIDIIIDTLTQALLQITVLESAAANVAAVSARAAELGDPQLQQIANLSSENLATEANNLSATLGSANSLMGIMTSFLSLIGVSAEVPNLSSLSGLSISEISEPIRGIITTLRTIRSIIPIP